MRTGRMTQQGAFLKDVLKGSQPKQTSTETLLWQCRSNSMRMNII